MIATNARGFDRYLPARRGSQELIRGGRGSAVHIYSNMLIDIQMERNYCLTRTNANIHSLSAVPAVSNRRPINIHPREVGQLVPRNGHAGSTVLHTHMRTRTVSSNNNK